MTQEIEENEVEVEEEIQGDALTGEAFGGEGVSLDCGGCIILSKFTQGVYLRY